MRRVDLIIDWLADTKFSYEIDNAYQTRSRMVLKPVSTNSNHVNKRSLGFQNYSNNFHIFTFMTEKCWK